ncbi:hypothetical protein FV139_17605 [Parahaliea maris]|uniref:DUF6946 domain-containing protein n=1 Tax=Parahaliea maris TaxID=2716870 RepID=A0A5C8ZSY5_9GAMM|nr:hypothetical protein [Parahaliea maris]TXS90790.1 hypothetical protein FV139_17605 [Parahaliea maris]
MKRIFVPTQSGDDWKPLLAKPDLHWKIGRSAMSTASCWETARDQLPQDLRVTLEASEDPALLNLELLAAIPEWEVELPGGKTSSCTDVMAIARNECGLVVLGVEAKVDEPFGPTLGEKRRNASMGQQERIRYLEAELHDGREMADEIRYQLMHRTVSAILTARAFHTATAAMIVQSFSADQAWREDFEFFARALDAEPVTEDLYQLHTPSGEKLYLGWCKGDLRHTRVNLADT